MAAAVTRELQAVYGTHTSGGTTEILIHSATAHGDAFTEAAWEMNVVVYGSSAALFKTACSDLEAAYRTPRKDLVVTMGGQTFVSWKHSDNTGFNADPHIEKVVPSKFNTGRSREYRILIRFGRPADVSDTSGRRDSRVSLRYAGSRRRQLSISGVYTALSSNTARQQYEASIAAYATAVQGVLGAFQWEKVNEQANADDQNKVLEFEVVYNQLIHSQNGSNYDDSALVNQVLIVSRAREAPGDSIPTARRLVRLQFNFSAEVDYTVTQDLSGKWAAVLPWVITRIRTVFGVSSVALVEQHEDHDYDNNVIRATGVLLAAGSTVLQYISTAVDDRSPGGVVQRYWVEGRPRAGRRYQGPETWIRTVNEEMMLLHGGVNVFGPLPVSAGINIEHVGASQTPKILGLSPYQINVVEARRTVRFEVFDDLDGGGGGGGGAGVFLNGVFKGTGPPIHNIFGGPR